MEKIDKNRNWTFLVYPDSTPKNWVEIIQDTGLPFAISPLHDKDENPDGTKKKPHYHIIVMFPGPTTFMKVNSLCAELNSPIPKRILSVVGMYRYFTHQDNPEKYQYNVDDIQQKNGFDIKEINGMTTSQILAIKKDIILLIQKYDFTEYSDLVDYFIGIGDTDCFDIISNHTLFFERYLTSRRNRDKIILDKAISPVLERR